MPTAEAQAAAGKLAALKVGINDASDTLTKWKFFTLVLCMMAGMASLPHVLMRYFTTSAEGCPPSVVIHRCLSAYCI